MTVVLMQDGAEPEAISNFARTECGVVLGHGLGVFSTKAFRIAQMDHVNASTILGILGVIESALETLAIPTGPGAMVAAIQQLGQQV